MFILGAATVSPDYRLSDGDLIGLGVKVDRGATTLLDRSGITSRAVSFSAEGLSAAANGFDLFENWSRAECSPTALGVKAVRLVLEQAGISIEQVGMALGDTATPYQTCPSEAQRIIGELGAKLPAFDIVGGGAALLQALSTFKVWSESRMPEYLLYVSTNTPSQQTRYFSDSAPATVMGDAAVALLISTKHTAKTRVVSAKMVAEKSRRMPFKVGQSIVFDHSLLASAGEVSEFVESELKALGIDLSRALIVPPPLYSRECVETLTKLGVSADRVVSSVDQIGYSFGGSLGVGLVRALDRAKSGQEIVLLHCGDGLRGSVVLRVE